MDFPKMKFSGLTNREIYVAFLAVGDANEASGLPKPFNSAEQELYKACLAKTNATEEAQAAATAAQTAQAAAEAAQAAAELAQAAAEAAAGSGN